MALQDERKSKSAIAYTYEYAFLSIQDMQDRIPSILGINTASLIRVDRFEGSDKARLHYRILSATNDGTGVPVKVRLNPDPSVTTETDMFANIAINIPFMKPAEGSDPEKMVYWDGTEYKDVGGGGGALLATYEDIEELIPPDVNRFYPAAIFMDMRDNALSVETTFYTQLVIDGKVKKLSYEDVQNLKATWTITDGEVNIGLEMNYEDGIDTDGAIRITPYKNGDITQTSFTGTLTYQGLTLNINGAVSTVEFLPDTLSYTDLNENTSQPFDLLLDKYPAEFNQNISDIIFQSGYISAGADQQISFEIMQGTPYNTGRWKLALWSNNPQNKPFAGNVSYRNKFLNFSGTTKILNGYIPNPMNVTTKIDQDYYILFDFYLNGIKQTPSSIGDVSAAFMVEYVSGNSVNINPDARDVSLFPDANQEFMLKVEPIRDTGNYRYTIRHTDSASECTITGTIS